MRKKIFTILCAVFFVTSMMARCENKQTPEPHDTAPAAVEKKTRDAAERPMTMKEQRQKAAREISEDNAEQELERLKLEIESDLESGD